MSARLIRVFAFLTALLFGVATQAQAPMSLPALGDGAEWSLGQERALGDSIMGQIWRDPDVIDDAILWQYVYGLWAPLLASARQRGELSAELEQRFAWDMILIRDRTVNAFALPGGYMGVHLGLISVASNRDELAAVLAHETSHVTQRHIARMLAQESRTTPFMIGAMLLGVLAASRSPDAASALMIGGQAAAIQNQLSFSRDMEREADRVGFGLLTPAGYDNEGAITLFDKLIQAARLNDSGAYPYLRSHPMSTERMADMASRAQQMGPMRKNTSSDLLHAMMSARARAITETAPDAQRKLMLDAQPDNLGSATNPATRVAALYAGIMAHAQARQFDQAHALLQKLGQQIGSTPALQNQLHWLTAEVNTRAGQHAAAWQALERVSPDVRNSRVHLIASAKVWVGSRQPEWAKRAASELDRWLNRHPKDGEAWDLNALAQDLAADPLRSLRAQAEARAVRFDLVAGIDRLLAAQDWVRQTSRLNGLTRGQEIEAAIIDTRLRQLRQLRREQTLQR